MPVKHRINLVILDFDETVTTEHSHGEEINYKKAIDFITILYLLALKKIAITDDIQQKINEFITSYPDLTQEVLEKYYPNINEFIEFVKSNKYPNGNFLFALASFGFELTRLEYFLKICNAYSDPPTYSSLL